MNILPLISRVIFSGLGYLRGRSVVHVAVCAVLLSAPSSPLLAANTIVRMEINYGDTPAGNIDIQLLDDQAPITVANFLRYAARGDYNGVMIHRSAFGQIIQGGGYKCCDDIGGPFPIPDKFPPIQNEFDPLRSNDGGTIAMAKLPATDEIGNPVPGGGPDSATSQWFFNVTDNSNPYDSENGGYTVFGYVTWGMSVVNAIANLPVEEFPLPFNQLPVVDYNPILPLQRTNLVYVNRVLKVLYKFTYSFPPTIVTFTTDADMTFNAGSTGAVSPTLVAQRLASFSSPPVQYANFNNGMFELQISGSSGSHVVTLYDGATTRPTHYYAYGPTPDNRTPHWYDFAFDGETGAVIGSDRITLHFVDGKRGDDDLDSTTITHAGAQVVLGPPPPPTPTQSSDAAWGCSIAANKSSQTLRGGDLILVSLFLGMLALRRRARGDRGRSATGN